MQKNDNERVNLKETLGLPARPYCRTNLNKVKALMEHQLGFSMTHNQVIEKLLADYVKLHLIDDALNNDTVS